MGDEKRHKKGRPTAADLWVQEFAKCAGSRLRDALPFEDDLPSSLAEKLERLRQADKNSLKRT